MTHWFFRFLDWSRRTPWMMALVLLASLAIGGWGFYAYYGLQFEWVGLDQWYYFPFIPDCPLFVYLFVAAIVGMYWGIRWPGFVAFAALGNIKYGIWTVFVLLYYFDRFFAGEKTEALFRVLILALHVGMVPMGILLWRTLPPLRRGTLLRVLVALLVFDYVDYFLQSEVQLYPIGLPNAGYRDGVPAPLSAVDLGWVPWFTLAETLLLAYGLHWQQKHRPVEDAQVAPAAPIS